MVHIITNTNTYQNTPIGTSESLVGVYFESNKVGPYWFRLLSYTRENYVHLRDISIAYLVDNEYRSSTQRQTLPRCHGLSLPMN